MTVELFEKEFWLSTSVPKQILNETEILIKHKISKKDSLKNLKKIYGSLGHPIIHKKKKFKIRFDNKKEFTIFVRDGYENIIKDELILEEEIYMNLKNKYKDHFKIIFEEY